MSASMAFASVCPAHPAGCTRMMELCDLHTILRLPTGIFHAQGVKTNVLFFSRGATEQANTKAVWVYDLRNNMPAFGKTRPLTVEIFAEFEAAFGDDRLGHAARVDQGQNGRFRCFTQEAIADRSDNLDITWLRDTEADGEDWLSDPEDIAAAIIRHLCSALDEIETLDEELQEEMKAEATTPEAADSASPQFVKWPV